jgi:hypothetical protein
MIDGSAAGIYWEGRVSRQIFGVSENETFDPPPMILRSYAVPRPLLERQSQRCPGALLCGAKFRRRRLSTIRGAQRGMARFRSSVDCRFASRRCCHIVHQANGITIAANTTSARITFIGSKFVIAQLCVLVATPSKSPERTDPRHRIARRHKSAKIGGSEIFSCMSYGRQLNA